MGPHKRGGGKEEVIPKKKGGGGKKKRGEGGLVPSKDAVEGDTHKKRCRGVPSREKEGNRSDRQRNGQKLPWKEETKRKAPCAEKTGTKRGDKKALGGKGRNTEKREPGGLVPRNPERGNKRLAVERGTGEKE